MVIAPPLQNMFGLNLVAIASHPGALDLDQSHWPFVYACTCSPSPRNVIAGQRLTLLLCRLHGCGCMSVLTTMIVVLRSRMLDIHPPPYRPCAATQAVASLEYLKTQIVHFHFTIRPPTSIRKNTHKVCIIDSCLSSF